MKVLSIKNAFNTMLKNIEVKEAEKLNKLINKAAFHATFSFMQKIFIYQLQVRNINQMKTVIQYHCGLWTKKTKR